MAFDFPHTNKNFIGAHADGAAATAWVLANCWDTNGNGTGTPQRGMMFFSTLTSQMYFWDSANWINYSGEIEGGIYVDEVYGSDASGDGSIGKPYATLVYACTQVVDPTMMSEFITPVTFYLAPGIYDGKVVLPQRLHITIVGDNCRVSQDMEWPINPDWWALYGLSLDLFPVLNIKRSGAVWGNEGMFSDPDYPQGFILEGGTLSAYNSNPLGVNPMPYGHNLTIDGALRAGFNIFNQPSGTASTTDVVGTLLLQLFNSMASPSGMPGSPWSWVCGEADRDTGSYDMNYVSVYAENSIVFMRGCCKIDRIHECYYHADRTINHDGDPYAWGAISAVSYGGLYENITQSMPFDECFFGCDPAAPAPACTEKLYAIIFDKQSLLRVADAAFAGSGMYADFYGFWTGADAAFGRGWWWGADECMGDHSVTRVPASDGFPFGPTANTEGMLLAHAYDYAQFWQPYSGSLSASNRLTIALEAGTYGLGDTLDVVSEFVDIIGMGGPQSSVMRQMGTSSIVEPSNVHIYVEHFAVRWYADDARMENIDIAGYGDNYAGESCMIMMATSGNSSFRNLTFGKFKYNLYAVMIDPALAPAACEASWQDCYTNLNGFLYGGNVAPGLCARCRAGDYSFGGLYIGGAPLDIYIGGRFQDCEGGAYSFAATRSGGNVQIAAGATFDRCRVTSAGFCHTSGGGGVSYTAICAGIFTDCDNKLVGGGNSFGYSAYGDATIEGTFIRCNSATKSFGFCDGPAGNGIVHASAVLIDCEASNNSFGSNDNSPFTAAQCSGKLTRCIGGYRCFGAQGIFDGQARDCRAGYGSFGYATQKRAAYLINCEVTDVTATAGQGPPGLWGAHARRCLFTSRAGQNVAPLIITGGLEGTDDETQIYDCDLYTDTFASCIYTPGPAKVEAQIAHCRMNQPPDGNVSNLIGAGNNVVDANYDPTP
jgi:hypothetical protein